MNRFKSGFAVVFTIGLMIFASLATQVSAQTSRVNEREVRQILRQLAVSVDDFQIRADYELRQRSSRINQSDISDLRASLDELKTEVNDFQNKLSGRRDSQSDVSLLLSAAKRVNDSLYNVRLSQRLQNDWAGTRRLFERLASNYGLSWDWMNGTPQYPTRDDYPNNYPTTGNYPNQGGNFSYGLTGTYQLDVTRSENATDVAERAIRNNRNVQNRDDLRQDLQNKLEAPERLAIEVRGNQITLASSLAAQVTVTADGRDRTETLADGRTLRVRTTLRGQELTISSVGGENDYTITFASIENGRSLRVTRRVTTDYLNQTVFAESIYNKTDATARFDIHDNADQDDFPSTSTPPATTTGRRGEFIVPDGVVITGNLENDITTKVSQNGDRFRMTVSAPTRFRGAVIEGYLSGINRSGKSTGRSQLTLNFESIRMPNGQVYDFAGFLKNVTDADGKPVKIDTEGTAQGESQTRETIKRGGIGAGLGAIIGAIAGGGKGAAIGAIIGGSAGAGSVYAQGRDDLELKAGSALTVQASSPIR